ncbi:FtsX-like permease family protein [Paenibacillus allorhizosphaerae]|uniref:ABC transporter permease protein YxdM n=1 Tax=Paenibacillus allorhizosphaerae TaxID=2849866 RepID=A0ABM8VGG1_9BACL|nr:ABC transporter permease [Paenibacillus allorhizosphaerae]CAG7638282.1 ABC transporter permease protein YxdM [Paenibacillus allorhizosphaerae]
MTFRQLALFNILRNKRIYAAHFMSSAFSVMIFFIYALLLFHPQLQGELEATSKTIAMLGSMGMKISQYLIVVFSFLFQLYSVSAFLKTRKKEFGILMIHGMSPRQQNRLIYIENMVIGGASIIAGSAVGLLFSKLILLAGAAALVIDRGLPFYFPLKAIGTTSGVFMALFLLISLFTSRIVRVEQLVELLKSEEKPKPEPKASALLSLLAVVLIGAGYAMVFFFAVERYFSFRLLFSGVACTVAGTYFLFTQLSVHVIRVFRNNKLVLLHRTNLITISEMMYRMKDNATMFFMIAVISAVAITGIGSCVSLANPGLSEMMNPYAFTYVSQQGNAMEKQHLAEIEKRLNQAPFAYRMGSFTPKRTTDGMIAMKLSDYNRLAAALGHPAETLDDHEQALLVPSTLPQKRAIVKNENLPSAITLLQEERNVQLPIQKSIPYIVTPEGEAGWIAVVSDSMYDRIPDRDGGTAGKRTYYAFAVKNWEQTKELAQALADSIPDGGKGAGYRLETPLVLQWIASRQTNGILLMISVLLGIVFFTFAASFLYFRLYTDLERDRKQYRMIAKVGLSRTELKTIVSRQLTVMFFIPLLMALIHSTVALTALQQLVDFSIAAEALTIFAVFIVVQTAYFFITRLRYLGHLVRKLA